MEWIEVEKITILFSEELYLKSLVANDIHAFFYKQRFFQLSLSFA